MKRSLYRNCQQRVNTFSGLCVQCPSGLLEAQIFGKLFFQFFLGFFHLNPRHFKSRDSAERRGFASEKSENAHYFFSRTASKVPSFEGRSPTSGEKSASPVIESGVSNFPLHVNFPASRPTLPSKNSTGPEKVIEFWSP